MKTPTFKALLLCSLLFSTLLVHANTKELILSYDGFFDRIEKLDEPQFATVKLAFYLRDIVTNKSCVIKDVKLKTKLKSRDVYFYDTGEILIPYDKQLDLDKANVVINHNDNAQCNLDMRLEAVTQFSEVVQLKSIVELIDTLDAALKEQGGMMAFLMPDVNGVTFIGENGIGLKVIESDSGLKHAGDSYCKDNRCTITKNNIKDVSASIKLSAKPVRVIAHIDKS
jgi:hypothetical protein